MKKVKRCSVLGCPDEAQVRGWCRPHYDAWYRTGLPYLKRDKPFLEPGKDLEAERRRLAASPPSNVRRGSARQNAKLTENQVRAIRRRYWEGDVPFSELARDYGVSRAAVESIVFNRTWRHVK